MTLFANRYALMKRPPRVGGMAEVHQAVDVEDGGARVAIKLFHKDFASSPLGMESYARECKSLQMLDHPNIVRILDGGTDVASGRKYIVMEWFETCLQDRIAGHTIAGWDDFYAELGRPLLQGLTHAYSRQVVHRDLKPGNILLSDEGAPKIADFGISRHRNSVQIGVTLAGYRSAPFSPPEAGLNTDSDSRDVYGFAAIALQSITPDPLVTYDDIYSALEEADVPEPIYQILSSALERDPSNRIPNVSELFHRLEAYQHDRESEWVDTRVLYVAITKNAINKIIRDYPVDAAPSLQRIICDDLNELCGIRPFHRDQPAKPGDQIHLELLSPQYRYQAAIDNGTEDHLVIVNIFHLDPSHLEFLRQHAWHASVRFRAGRPPREHSGRSDIEWLLNQVAEHENRLRATPADGKSLFHLWDTMLTMREQFERESERPILFTDARLNGNRLYLSVHELPDDDLVGQLRYLKVDDRSSISGEIDDVSANEIVLWVTHGTGAQPPKQGRLLFDTRANRTAIQRQRTALSAVRSGQAARADMAHKLERPELAATPQHEQPTECIQPELDADKRNAVTQAMASDDFYVVEGPPGTGKTRFITEIILQTLRKKPSARILLSSQTHVALDNALERVLQIAPSTNAVRIARSDDSRVAQAVRDTLLENKADSWFASIAKRSDDFLSTWLSEQGIDRSEVTLGIAVGRYRLALVDQEQRQNQFDGATNRLESLVQQRAAAAHGQGATALLLLEEQIATATEMLEDLRSERVRAEARAKDAKKSLVEAHELGSDLSKLSLSELRGWEQDLIDRNSNASHARNVIDLVEEWKLRFGRSSDFYAALLAEAQVVAGTCIGFMRVPGIDYIDYDLCIIDEASKATPTEALVPLSRARRWILVGDRNQLPPFVDTALTEPGRLDEFELSRPDLERTLFDHLLQELPSDCTTRLFTQHRMVRPIGDLVSNCFYDGALVSPHDALPPALPAALPKPVTWYSTSRLSDRHEVYARPSFKNLRETRCVIDVLQRINFLAGSQNTEYSVVVLTGYGAQRIELEREAARRHDDLGRLRVSFQTVDAFQGREADIAVYSVTRSNPSGIIGFLRERRRLNVALSRGRIALVVVGDHLFCRAIAGDNPFADVLHHIATNKDDCVLEEIAQ